MLGGGGDYFIALTSAHLNMYKDDTNTEHHVTING